MKFYDVCKEADIVIKCNLFLIWLCGRKENSNKDLFQNIRIKLNCALVQNVEKRWTDREFVLKIKGIVQFTRRLDMQRHVQITPTAVTEYDAPQNMMGRGHYKMS